VPRAKQGRPEYLLLKRQLHSEMTRAEKRFWSRLRMKQVQGLKFRRQHGIGAFIVDFYCPEGSLVIEVDGDTHADENQVRKDKQRETYLRSLGLRVIRYMNDDILNNVDGVLEDLCERLSSGSTSPNPLLTKEGDRRGRTSLQRRGQRTRP